jgi:hypothetical protein
MMSQRDCAEEIDQPIRPSRRGIEEGDCHQQEQGALVGDQNGRSKKGLQGLTGGFWSVNRPSGRLIWGCGEPTEAGLCITWI